MALTRPTAYQINTVSTTITDPLTVLNQGSTAANIDIGFILNRNPSANVAIVWQASSNQFIFANTSSSGTTNANITVSNYANLRAGNLIATSVTYANGQSILTNVESAITTANTNLKGYVDGQISTTGTSVTTANTNMKGYVDGQISTTTTAITTANTNLKGYTDNLVSTANVNLKGYVDSANTLQSSQISAANTAITTANTNMKGYVDGQISTTTTAITTANTNLKGYTDNLVTTANTNLKGYTDGQISTTTTAITTANTNMKGYVDSANTLQSSQISAANTAITTANTNLKGYTDNLVTTANTNMKGYVDNINSTLTANAGAQANSISSLTTTKANLSGAVFTGAVTTTELFVTSAGGDEGGQLNLANATTNTTLSGNIVIDVYQNKLRIFEGGGTARGGYFDLSGLSAGVGTNLAAGGGGTPGGTNSQIQFNNSSSFGGATSLYYFSGNGVVLANAAVASTSTTTGALQVSGGIGVAGNVWCGQVYSTNNGNGTNYRIGDDAWLGDVNVADTTQLMGAQNGNNGYLRFGNVGTETLGRAGSGALTWTGTFSATNINSDNHNYANGTSIITTLSTTITTANTNMKGYIDSANTIQSNQIAGANATMVTSVTGAAPVTSSGGKTPAISMAAATALANGYMTSTYAAKLDGIAAGATNVTNTNQLTNGAGFVTASVTLTTAAQTNITSVGTLGSLSVTGNISAANSTASFGLWGTIRTAAQTSITSVGTLTSLAVSGAITVNSGAAATAIVNGATTGVGNIGASGAAFNTVFAKSTSAQYADLAEVYRSDRNYIPGTVVVFGGTSEVTVSLTSHDTKVAGVVSTNPAYLMNDREEGVAVALQGRVPCRVLGPVVKGDRVVTSDVRGVAERLDMTKYQPGCIIGKTLGSVPNGEIATIEVVVGRV
jgi:hypothetical protein